MKIVCMATKLLATIILAVLMVLVIYQTNFGIAVARLIPQAFWYRFHEVLGFTKAEEQYDAELIVFLAICIVLAMIVVATTSVLYNAVRHNQQDSK